MERLKNIDSRWMYVLLSLVIMFPLIRPLGLPQHVGSHSRQMVDELSVVRPGSRVLMVMSYTISASPDTAPGAAVVFRSLLRSGARVIFVSLIPESVRFAEDLILEGESAGRQYGTDFVNLGYVAGGETALAAVAANLAIAETCNRGLDLVTMPIMEGLTTAADVDLGVMATAGSPGVEDWARQIVATYGTRSLLTATTGHASRALPYLQTGQISGLIMGMRGAAEVEQLTGLLGVATSAMDAQSMAHLFFVGLVIVVNVGAFAARRRPAR